MTEGRPIVVGVDGSSGSEAAVGWAVREASLRGLPLRVVHATLPRHLPAMRSMAVETTTDWMDHAREIATAGAMAARRSDPTLSVDVQVYLNETPAQALAREAGSAALLVLGPGEPGSFAGRLHRSEAARTIELASTPVVIVHPSLGGTPAGPAAGQVVVTVDRSAQSRRAARFALEEAALHRTGLIMVTGRPGSRTATSSTARDGINRPAWQREVRTILAETKAMAARDFPGVEVQDRSLAERGGGALVDASRGAEVLVVGWQRSRVLGRIFRPASYRALQLARCPVAVVR